MIKSIKPLNQNVVNRIAAGEVINSPSNVIKEVLENSIDAGSTKIIVEIERGGYSVIKIIDNGCGINYDDMHLACRRHTTSKLQEFSDLAKISTFGFRGEALHSISCVSKLRIITKTANDPVGTCANYSNGEVVGQMGHIATTNGTTIEARDLFYNYQARISSGIKPAAEARIITDIVSKYSIIHPKIAFTVKSDKKETLLTYGGEFTSNETVLRQIFGLDDVNFLRLNFEILISNENSQIITINNLNKPNISNNNGENDANDELSPSLPNKKGISNVYVELFISETNVKIKKKANALFINGRLVENDKLKKGLEDVYGGITVPFSYITLTMPSQNVDVNVHPSKKIVKFLGENEIVNEICRRVKEIFEEHHAKNNGLIQSRKRNTINPTTSKHNSKDNNNSGHQPSILEALTENSTNPIQSIVNVSTRENSRNAENIEENLSLSEKHNSERDSPIRQNVVVENLSNYTLDEPLSSVNVSQTDCKQQQNHYFENEEENEEEIPKENNRKTQISSNINGKDQNKSEEENNHSGFSSSLFSVFFKKSQNNDSLTQQVSNKHNISKITSNKNGESDSMDDFIVDDKQHKRDNRKKDTICDSIDMALKKAKENSLLQSLSQKPTSKYESINEFFEKAKKGEEYDAQQKKSREAHNFIDGPLPTLLSQRTNFLEDNDENDDIIDEDEDEEKMKKPLLSLSSISPNSKEKNNISKDNKSSSPERKMAIGFDLQSLATSLSHRIENENKIKQTTDIENDSDGFPVPPISEFENPNQSMIINNEFNNKNESNNDYNNNNNNYEEILNFVPENDLRIADGPAFSPNHQRKAIEMIEKHQNSPPSPNPTTGRRGGRGKASNVFDDLKYEPKRASNNNNRNSSNQSQQIMRDPKMQTLEDIFTNVEVKKRPIRIVKLESILTLRNLRNDLYDESIKKIFTETKFIGFVGTKCVVFREKNRKGSDVCNYTLHLINLFALMKDLFTHKFLEMFANLPSFSAEICINEALQIQNSSQSLTQQTQPTVQKRYQQHISTKEINKNNVDINDLKQNEVEYENEYENVSANDVVTLLEEHKVMLLDYFGISFQKDTIKAMPDIICGYRPSFTGFPFFLERLITAVNWEEEMECFDNLISELSSLYAIMPEDDEDKRMAENLKLQFRAAVIQELSAEDYKPSIDLRNEGAIVSIQLNDIF